MVRKDPRIDAYIARSAPFARPILEHLRELVHAGCPDVEETLKWNSPSFMYKGILCGMAAFKRHATFGFRKGAMLAPQAGKAFDSKDEAMGQFGRITSLDDLPSDRVMIRLIRAAVALQDRGGKRPAKPRAGAKRTLEAARK